MIKRLANTLVHTTKKYHKHTTKTLSVFLIILALQFHIFVVQPSNKQLKSYISCKENNSAIFDILIQFCPNFSSFYPIPTFFASFESQNIQLQIHAKIVKINRLHRILHCNWASDIYRFSIKSNFSISIQLCSNFPSFWVILAFFVSLECWNAQL